MTDDYIGIHLGIKKIMEMNIETVSVVSLTPQIIGVIDSAEIRC
jgi:hypothetical protein